MTRQEWDRLSFAMAAVLMLPACVGVLVCYQFDSPAEVKHLPGHFTVYISMRFYCELVDMYVTLFLDAKKCSKNEK